MSFFKWYGGMQRKILSRFNHLFVQDAESKKLIDGIGLSSICSVAGDTRFDRVIEIATSSKSLPHIEKFISGNKVLIAGSTWKNDEELLKKLDDEIWEFRTLYNKSAYRLFAFWDKSEKSTTLVISTHGIIKKTDKIPESEFEKAEQTRQHYFKSKKQ